MAWEVREKLFMLTDAKSFSNVDFVVSLPSIYCFSFIRGLGQGLPLIPIIKEIFVYTFFLTNALGYAKICDLTF